MPARSERDVVVGHAIRDLGFLEVALKVGGFYDDIRNAVVTRFLARVATELPARVGPGWKVVHVATEVFGPDSEELISVQDSSHPGKFYVALGKDEGKYPFNPFFCVRADSDEATLEHVKAIVDRECGPGKRDYSLWYRYLDKSYWKWGTFECMVLLYDSEVMVEYVVNNFVALTQALDVALA